MGKSLIITEKPSVAVEFAKVLQVSGRKDGYIENDKYVITWCVGHLVGMVYPESYDEKYKKWKLEELPFLPKDYKYDVIKEVAKQYEELKLSLWKQYEHDRDAYTNAKTDFVKEYTKKAKLLYGDKY